MKLRNKTYLYLGAAFGLLVFLYYSGWLNPVFLPLRRFAMPVLSGMYGVGTDLKSAYERQTGKFDAGKEIDDLRDEVMKLREENARLKNVFKENDILREHLGFLERNKLEYAMASVIFRADPLSGNRQAQALAIDKGREDGIAEGAAVLNRQGVMVGKISEVKDGISMFYLTTSERCKIASTILGEDSTSGIAQGSQDLVVRMDFIPQLKNLKPGDIVVTSGLEEAVPRGLVIGKIAEVKKENNELWQSAVVEPFINADDLSIVSVVLN